MKNKEDYIIADLADMTGRSYDHCRKTVKIYYSAKNMEPPKKDGRTFFSYEVFLELLVMIKKPGKETLSSFASGGYFPFCENEGREDSPTMTVERVANMISNHFKGMKKGLVDEVKEYMSNNFEKKQKKITFNVLIERLLGGCPDGVISGIVHACRQDLARTTNDVELCRACWNEVLDEICK